MNNSFSIVALIITILKLGLTNKTFFNNPNMISISIDLSCASSTITQLALQSLLLRYGLFIIYLTSHPLVTNVTAFPHLPEPFLPLKEIKFSFF